MGTKEQGSGFYRFKVGEFEVASVSDGFLRFENPRTMIAAGATDEEFQAFMESRFLPSTSAYFQINSLYVDTGKHKVLIDNGMGAVPWPIRRTLAGSVTQPSRRSRRTTPSSSPMPIWIKSSALSHPMALSFFQTRYVIGEQEWAYWMKPDIKLGNLLPEELKQMIVAGRAHMTLAIVRPIVLELARPSTTPTKLGTYFPSWQ